LELILPFPADHIGVPSDNDEEVQSRPEPTNICSTSETTRLGRDDTQRRLSNRCNWEDHRPDRHGQSQNYDPPNAPHQSNGKKNYIFLVVNITILSQTHVEDDRPVNNLVELSTVDLRS